MTDSEFDDLRRDIAAAFPRYLSWFKSLPAATQDSQRNAIRRALAPLDYAEVLEAIEEMQTDDSKGLGSFPSELERAPGVIRRVVMDRRQEKAREESRGTVDRLAGERGLAEAFEKAPPLEAWALIQKRISEGATVQEASIEVFGQLDPEREPRFKCSYCRDSGGVLVWRKEAVRAAMQGVIEERRDLRIVGVIRCSCEAGDGCFGAVRFSLEDWCPCKGGPHDPQSIEDLRRWIDAKIAAGHLRQAPEQQEFFT